MIPSIITALKAAGTDFVTIDHALSMEPIDNLEVGTPALFLFEGEGKGLDSDGDSCVEQVEVRSVIAFIVCPWVDLETLRDQEKNVIRGYQFKPAQTPLKLASSQTVSIKGEYIWRKDTYTTTDYS